MHLPGEANKGAVSPIAIVGAALRFPGAADPAAFHELTVTGRRMFQDITHIAAELGITRLGDSAPGSAGHLPHAALLDDEAIPEPGTAPPPDTPAELPGITHVDRVTARYLLAADAGAAALADVPVAGRPSQPGRTGVIIADTAKPGVPDVAGWVRGRLGLADPGTGHGAHTCSLRAI